MKNTLRRFACLLFYAVVCFASAACSTQPSVGSSMSRNEAKIEIPWKQGKEQVIQGEKMIKMGEQMIKDGRGKMQNGEAARTEGQKLVESGMQLMDKSLRYLGDCESASANCR